MNEEDRMLIGGEEWCALPDLGLPWIKSRVDSGARTSSLHAWGIRRFQRDGHDWVSFRVHPLQRDRRTMVACEAPLADRRGVKSSSGATESRYVIMTTLSLAGASFPVEITLTGRDAMGYRMLLGREAMLERLIVDPSQSFRCPVPAAAEIDTAYAPHRSAAPHLQIGLLCEGETNDLARSLSSAAASRRHTVRWIHPDRCVVVFENQHETISCAGLPSDVHLDSIVSLGGRGGVRAHTALLRHFEQLGAFNPNPARAALEAVGPVVAYQRLVRSGVSLPYTGWYPAGSSTLPDDAPRYLVRDAENGEARLLARESLRASPPSGEGLLLQSLPAAGELLRCYVAGTRVVVTPLAARGDGVLARPRGRAPTLSRENRREIRRAVRSLGVHLARVDALVDPTRLLILDVDPFAYAEVPGRTAVTYASAMLKFLERATGALARSAG